MYYLVKDDVGTQLKATLTRADDGTPVDLTDATVVMRFRAKGSTAILFTLTSITISADDLLNGVAIFQFGAGNLNVAEGKYQGEIEATFTTGKIESVYEILEFYVRADFD